MHTQRLNIGILAGSGSLPHLLIDQAHKKGDLVSLVTFVGQTDADTFPRHISQLHTHFGQVGAVVDFLKKSSVTHLIFAGGMKRPKVSELRLDFKGAQWLTKLAFLRGGDDQLIRSLMGLFENEGFHMLPPDQYLGQENLFLGKGFFTKCVPTPDQEICLQKAVMVLNALSPFDIGQAVVIQNSQVLGIEGPEGTQGLIERCTPFISNDHKPILVKMVKQNQTLKADLPTIGLDTIKQLEKSGFAGIAVDAYGCQVLHKKEVIQLADEKGLFIIGFDRKIL